MICLALAVAGLSLATLATAAPLAVLLAATVVYGAAYAPLTILAQTLRMRLIPPKLRGRSFALLRMLMQSGNPVGGLSAGLLAPLAGLTATDLATPFWRSAWVRWERWSDRFDKRARLRCDH